jgi:hypothetical protein
MCSSTKIILDPVRFIGSPMPWLLYRVSLRQDQALRYLGGTRPPYGKHKLVLGTSTRRYGLYSFDWHGLFKGGAPDVASEDVTRVGNVVIYIGLLRVICVMGWWAVAELRWGRPGPWPAQDSVHRLFFLVGWLGNASIYEKMNCPSISVSTLHVDTRSKTSRLQGVNYRVSLFLFFSNLSKCWVINYVNAYARWGLILVHLITNPPWLSQHRSHPPRYNDNKPYATLSSLSLLLLSVVA